MVPRISYFKLSLILCILPHLSYAAHVHDDEVKNRHVISQSCPQSWLIATLLLFDSGRAKSRLKEAARPLRCRALLEAFLRTLLPWGTFLQAAFQALAGSRGSRGYLR